MDQMFMDQIIDSFLEDECGLPSFRRLDDNPLFQETKSQRHAREQKEEAERQRSTCHRCGGPLHWGTCNCYWDPGDAMNAGEWRSGND